MQCNWNLWNFKLNRLIYFPLADILFSHYWRFCWRNVSRQLKATFHPTRQIHRQRRVRTGPRTIMRTIVFLEISKWVCSAAGISIFAISNAWFLFKGFCTANREREASTVDQQCGARRFNDQSAASPSYSFAGAWESSGALSGLLYSIHCMSARENAVWESAAFWLRDGAH